MVTQINDMLVVSIDVLLFTALLLRYLLFVLCN